MSGVKCPSPEKGGVSSSRDQGVGRCDVELILELNVFFSFTIMFKKKQMTIC